MAYARDSSVDIIEETSESNPDLLRDTKDSNLKGHHNNPTVTYSVSLSELNSPGHIVENYSSQPCDIIDISIPANENTNFIKPENSGTEESSVGDSQESGEDPDDNLFTTASRKESHLAFKSRPVGSFRVSLSCQDGEDQLIRTSSISDGKRISRHSDRCGGCFVTSCRADNKISKTMGNTVGRQSDTMCSSIDNKGTITELQGSDLTTSLEHTNSIQNHNVTMKPHYIRIGDPMYTRTTDSPVLATVDGDFNYPESYTPEIYTDPELCGLTSASSMILNRMSGYSVTNTPSANVTPSDEIASPVFDFAPDSPATHPYILPYDPRFVNFLPKSSSDNYISQQGAPQKGSGESPAGAVPVIGTTARHGLAWSYSNPGTKVHRAPQLSRRSVASIPSGSVMVKPSFRFPPHVTSRTTTPQTTTPAPPPPALLRSISTTVPILRSHIQQLNSDDTLERLSALREILVMLDDAWAMPVVGKELAYKLCDVLRTDGALTRLISLCIEDGEGTQATVEAREVRRLSAKVLSRSMVVNNRDYIARNHIETLVNLFEKVKDDYELSQATTKILECLFKDSKTTCTELIKLGALDTLLHFCKALDTRILRNCAGALANLALYGGSDNQKLMVEHNAQLWLFPLAFSTDDSIRYYALLAIAALSANKELEQAVVESGTLQLVEQFLRSHDPEQFGLSDSEHIHGQSDTWVQRLVPILRSTREEAVSLAAFHFAMEAGIRQKKGDIGLFKTAHIVRILKRLASGANRLAARFACQALRIAGEQIPRKLSTRVSLWTTDDVACWLHQLGMGDHVIRRFEECQVDGDLLLLMNEDNLTNDIRMSNGITRKRFLRELDELKQSVDYSMYDSSNLNQFLRDIHPEMCRYTYRMLKSRVTLSLLPELTEKHLMEDCGVYNGVHRLIITNASRSLLEDKDDASIVAPNSAEVNTDVRFRDYDAFISYRRSCGSLLASLLKVYLEIRGFRVFLDIDGMLAGKFDENLLKTIAHSKNFLLVLSPNTLDRCIGDDEVKDWVHRELVAAIESQCKIIPVVQEGHVFPDPEQLPADIRCIEKYQAIMWNSDFHDACIDKLVRYMCDQEPAALVHPTISKDRSISRESASSGSRT